MRARGRTRIHERTDAGREHVPEHAVTQAEAGHARPNGLDRARHVESNAFLARRTQAHEQPGERRVQPVEIRPVDRGSLDADEHLVGLGGGVSTSRTSTTSGGP